MSFFDRFKKKKKYEEYVYKFLCRRCDIFFYRNNINKNCCPCCNGKGELYEVKPKKINQIED